MLLGFAEGEGEGEKFLCQYRLSRRTEGGMFKFRFTFTRRWMERVRREAPEGIRAC
jgi:hypothetical protein